MIPAAGRGSRLGADRPKPLVPVAGRTMLDRILSLHARFVDRVVVIAAPDWRGSIEAWAQAHRVTVAEQPSPTGMLDAILAAASAVETHRPDAVWITWVDQVGVLPQTLERLADRERRDPTAAMVLPTVRRVQPYIHFARDAAGRIAGVLQRREGDAMPAEGEGDIGVFALTRQTFDRDLRHFAAHAVSGAGTRERNFLPFIPWLAQRHPVATIPCTDPMEAIGINTPEDLRAIEAWLLSRSDA